MTESRQVRRARERSAKKQQGSKYPHKAQRLRYETKIHRNRKHRDDLQDYF